jgi:predicted ATP-binding protein involved in virulence
MRVICIRPLRRDPNNTEKWSVLKGLREEEFYYLYDGYEIGEDFINLTGRSVPDDLYYPQRYAKGDTDANFKVDICAIVGENGAGKSTLVDIYIRVINNLAAYVYGEGFMFPKAEHLHFIPGVFAEVYIEIERTIYCIRCFDDVIEVLVFRLQKNEKRYEREIPNLLADLLRKGEVCKPHLKYIELLSDLCYNTVLNYSLHSYNSTAYKDEDTPASKEIMIRKAGFEQGLYRPQYMFDENGNVKQLNKELLDKNFPEGYSWLSGMFHKNDGFQTPIVISPKRDYGMIDINNENQLSEERLLSLLFVENPAWKNTDGKRFPFSEINEKLRIEGFTLQTNNEVVKKYKVPPKSHPDLPEYSTELYTDLSEFIKSEYVKTFHLRRYEKYHNEAAVNYLVAKTIKIFMTYPRYERTRGFLARKRTKLSGSGKDGLTKDLQELWQDHSHITTKLWRTLNYLRYDHIDKSKSFQTYQLADRIHEILDDIPENMPVQLLNYPPRNTNEMLPPPIFKVDFHVYEKEDTRKKHRIRFSTLSSGEKQITYILCSLFYYMICLDSAKDFLHTYQNYKEQVEYKHINVIFDEIELYFHPEMQRNFISTLLHGLQQLPLEGIKSLHFIIVTHSPFVLSDIPAQNILLLEKGGNKADKSEVVSFGANIHTMLMNSFFLKGGAMGQFAKETVLRMIDQVNAVYLKGKLNRFNGNVERMMSNYYQIFRTLPGKYQEQLKKGYIDESDIDWQFIGKMTDVIQEPVIRRRLKEVLEWRKNYVDIES